MRPRRALTVGAVGLAALVLAGCGDADVAARPAVDRGIVVLAKENTWRQALQSLPDAPYGLVEVAYDAPTGARAWQENQPAVPTPREGDPTEPGVYGDPAAVDYTEQVLVVWSGGQSGSCPGWLRDLRLENGTVDARRGEFVPGDGCTDDYSGYRMVLAVDRDRLPPAEDLPVTDGLVDGERLGGGLVVAAYPYVPAS